MNNKTIAFIRVVLFLGTIVIQQITFATVNDVIIILDPDRKETPQNDARALTSTAILALQEKAAPIITSSNVLEIITNLRQQIGDNDLLKLRTLIQTNSDYETMKNLVNELIASHNINPIEEPNDIALLSLIDFDNSNWNFYLHKSEHLALLIPKQYI